MSISGVPPLQSFLIPQTILIPTPSSTFAPPFPYLTPQSKAPMRSQQNLTHHFKAGSTPPPP